MMMRTKIRRSSKVEIIREGARRGDGDSAGELGYLYESGELCDSCSPDYAEANRLFRRAISLKADGYSAWRLAENYWSGHGVVKNGDEGLRWAIFAARVGQDRAVPFVYEILAMGDL
jgi:TPR repeat protein